MKLNLLRRQKKAMILMRQRMQLMKTLQSRKRLQKLKMLLKRKMSSDW